jgi:hypothetical protein
LTNFWASEYWSCTDSTRGSSCHPRRCPSIFWPKLSAPNSVLGDLVLVGKLIKLSTWAFEHFWSVLWTDDSVGSSGSSHFCANTSLYVSRKSIGWTDVIIWWYHQIILYLYTCFLLLRSSSDAHKNGTVGSSYALFSTHLNLGITFHSGFRFWWSWTLWKACGIIFVIMLHFIPFDWSKNNLVIGQVQFIPLFIPASYFFFCHALHCVRLHP